MDDVTIYSPDGQSGITIATPGNSWSGSHYVVGIHTIHADGTSTDSCAGCEQIGDSHFDRDSLTFTCQP